MKNQQKSMKRRLTPIDYVQQARKKMNKYAPSSPSLLIAKGAYVVVFEPPFTVALVLRNDFKKSISQGEGAAVTQKRNIRANLASMLLAASA